MDVDRHFHMQIQQTRRRLLQARAESHGSGQGEYCSLVLSPLAMWVCNVLCCLYARTTDDPPIHWSWAIRLLHRSS